MVSVMGIDPSYGEKAIMGVSYVTDGGAAFTIPVEGRKPSPFASVMDARKGRIAKFIYKALMACPPDFLVVEYPAARRINTMAPMMELVGNIKAAAMFAGVPALYITTTSSRKYFCYRYKQNKGSATKADVLRNAKLRGWDTSVTTDELEARVFAQCGVDAWMGRFDRLWGDDKFILAVKEVKRWKMSC